MNQKEHKALIREKQTDYLMQDIESKFSIAHGPKKVKCIKLRLRQARWYVWVIDVGWLSTSDLLKKEMYLT